MVVQANILKIMLATDKELLHNKESPDLLLQLPSQAKCCNPFSW